MYFKFYRDYFLNNTKSLNLSSTNNLDDTKILSWYLLTKVARLGLWCFQFYYVLLNRILCRFSNLNNIK